MKLILLTLLLSVTFSSILIADTSTCPTEAIDNSNRGENTDPNESESETEVIEQEANET